MVAVMYKWIHFMVAATNERFVTLVPKVEGRSGMRSHDKQFCTQ